MHKASFSQKTAVSSLQSSGKCINLHLTLTEPNCWQPETNNSCLFASPSPSLCALGCPGSDRSSLTQNQGMTWVGRDLRDQITLFQPLCQGCRCHPLDQAAHTPCVSVVPVCPYIIQGNTVPKAAAETLKSYTCFPFSRERVLPSAIHSATLDLKMHLPAPANRSKSYRRMNRYSS